MKGQVRCLAITCALYCLLFAFVWSDVIVGKVEDSNSVGDFQLPRGFEKRQAAPETANLTQTAPNPQLAEPEVANPAQNPAQTVPRPQLPQGHFHHLGSCRRQLTFLASVALGAFITRVIKDSPLTPLPMPPLPNSLHWNLVRVPAHLAGHIMQWVEKHPAGQPVILNQGFAGLARSSSDDPWTRNLLRIRRDLTRQLKSSPDLILSAVQRTLKPLKLIHHAIGMQNWLLRWCH